MFVEVIIEIAYGEGRRADYPNLAGKVNLYRYTDLHASLETYRFCVDLTSL
jgi:hypothetical protein